MHSLSFDVVSDIEKAKELWNHFSPHNTIDDEWDFRYIFFHDLGYKLNFVTAYDGDTPVMLLPLQENTGEKLQPPYKPTVVPFLEFFGGDDTDNNSVFITPGYESHLSELLDKATRNVVLAPLAASIIGNMTADFYTNLYIHDISTYTTHDDFITHTWTGDSRGKFRRSIKTVYRDYEVTIVRNRTEDIDTLFELNYKRFGEGSSFRFDYRRSIFKQLVEQFESEIVTIEINGTVEAVSFGIYYKNVYYAMNIGVNEGISNVGKLLIMQQIDCAIEKKCVLYDAGKGDSGWKEIYKFTKIPQYILDLTK